jgi:hypothetical protein
VTKLCLLAQIWVQPELRLLKPVLVRVQQLYHYLHILRTE